MNATVEGILKEIVCHSSLALEQIFDIFPREIEIFDFCLSSRKNHIQIHVLFLKSYRILQGCLYRSEKGAFIASIFASRNQTPFGHSEKT